jgi:hypothetical protein
VYSRAASKKTPLLPPPSEGTVSSVKVQMEVAVELPSSIHLDNFEHMDNSLVDLDSSTNNSEVVEVVDKVLVGRLPVVGLHNSRSRDSSSTKAVLSQFRLPRRNDAPNHHNNLCYGHDYHHDLWNLQSLVV